MNPPLSALRLPRLLATLLTLAFALSSILHAAPTPTASPAVATAFQPTSTYHTSAFDHVLGTSLELKFEAATPAAATAAETAALAEIDRLDHILSGYDATSEFSRWAATRGEPIRVSAELFEVLALFDAWRERTGGALAAAAETAARLWQEAAARQSLPTAAELAAAVATAGQLHWRLDPAARTATHLTTAPLRLNSFAKSYIIEHAARAALRTGGITTAVVNIGGDLVVRGASADTIGVTDPLAAAENSAPLAHVALRDRAIATSGDYRRGLTIGGQWYSHLVDPRTARPVGHVHSATIVSHSATDAGALATALCVLPVAEGTALARTFADTDYLLVLADGTRLVSPGWSNLADPTTPLSRNVLAAVAPASSSSATTLSPTATTSAAPSATEAPAPEILINLQVASIAGGRVRRPFVAVWVENADGEAVRTIGLWYNRERWLPELREWSRAQEKRPTPARSPESLSSATRGPGQYTLRWDGKDDNGFVLPPGKYTIKIEAAREHGTHQLASGDIDTTGPTKHLDLPKNAELSALSIDLRRPTPTP